MRQGWKLGVALALALIAGLVSAPPAVAETVTITDPTGDAENQNGSTVVAPKADIKSVTVDHRPSSLEVTITPAEVVPASDPSWENFEIIVGAVFALEGSWSDEEEPDTFWFWDLVVFDGSITGLLYQNDEFVCATDARITATAYELSADGHCVRNIVRAPRFGALIATFSQTELALDLAPDDEFSEPVEAAASAAVGRVAGTDRILTAIELSKDVFDDGQAEAAVVAAAFNFPDALAGGPLARAAGGPLLLTDIGGLDPRVAAELERVLPTGAPVYVLGGTLALSEQVVSDIRALGFDPDRVAGVNRFETAVAIADETDRAMGEEQHWSVLIADGRTFQDALIASAAAPSVGGVVLLTDGTTLPAATAAYLSSDDSDRMAIGSTAAAAAGGVRSYTASTAAGLSVKVANELVGVAGIVAVANDVGPADALAGGPHIAAYGAPLLLTAPNELSAPVGDLLGELAPLLREVVIYGGTVAVSPGVEQSIRSIVGA